MSYLEFACEGRLLMRLPGPSGGEQVPRIGEVVVLDERPYEVVDVEYWARRPDGKGEKAELSPTVHVNPISAQRWEARLMRRQARKSARSGQGRY